MTTRVGAVFRPQSPPEQLLSTARAADDAGLDELWLWEDCFLEGGLTSAAAALASTTRLRIGIGLLPVPLRNVALAAMEIATVDRLFPGRLVVTVGHGVPPWMEQVGARVASPLTLMTEYHDALTRLLAGERVTAEGRYVRLREVELGWPSPHPGPVLIGAEGERSLRQSGELASGTVLTGGTSPEKLRRALERIAEGRARRLGTPGPGSSSQASQTEHRVVVYVAAVFGPDAGARLEVEQSRWDWEPGALTGLAGSPAEVADGLGAWIDAGADTVVLQPTADEEHPQNYVAHVGEVARLLRRG